MRTELEATRPLEGTEVDLSEALLSFFGLRRLEGACSDFSAVTLFLAPASVALSCGSGTPPIDSGLDAQEVSRSIFLGRRLDPVGASGVGILGFMAHRSLRLGLLSFFSLEILKSVVLPTFQYLRCNT